MRTPPNPRRFAVAILAATLACTPEAGSQSTTVAITNVDVIPMDRERVLTRQTVVVRDGVIADIGPAVSIQIPAGTTRIDGSGKFLLPGFADLHVHLAGSREQQLSLFRMFIANGVTTVLNLRGTPDHLALRRDVREGKAFGPTLYTTGPFVNEPFVRTVVEVDSAVRQQKRLGYDFVKMHGDLTRDAYARLHSVAKEVGIKVIGHAPRNLGIEALFEEDQYALAHAEEFLYDRSNSSRNYLDVVPRFPEFARSMARTGKWLMPNLTAYHIIGIQVGDIDSMLRRPEMKYLPAAYRLGWEPATNPYTARFPKSMAAGLIERHAALQQLTREFQQGGVRLLVGTDALNVGVLPGFSIHDELHELVVAGLTPYQSLTAATSNAAAFLGVKSGGIVARGNIADLVLLDANPLVDIGNTRRIRGVMMRGRWIPRTALDSILHGLADGR